MFLPDGEFQHQIWRRSQQRDRHGNQTSWSSSSHCFILKQQNETISYIWENEVDQTEVTVTTWSSPGSGSGSPAGPSEPWSPERLPDDRQELVPPPPHEGRPGVSVQERSQVQSLRQRAGGAHWHQVKLTAFSLIGWQVRRRPLRWWWHHTLSVFLLCCEDIHLSRQVFSLRSGSGFHLWSGDYSTPASSFKGFRFLQCEIYWFYLTLKTSLHCKNTFVC